MLSGLTTLGAVVSVDFERVILEAMVAIATPPCSISILTFTEVEVAACDSPEACALHRERTSEVDLMISYIDAVEHEYWGDMFV